jgi:hypothetical protein
MATVRLQLRRGLADDWFDANPTLAAGEIGIETDTNTFKFGDGNTPWNSLEYALSGTVDDYIPLNTKAQAGGVASLDSSGFVPVSQLPPLVKVTVNAVADQSARLALTAEAGDIAIQADNGQSYVLSASPASTDANWKALVGSEAVVDTVEAALVAGTGLDKTYNDASGTITIDIDSTVATKTYADQAEADAISTASADATSKANAAASAAASALSSHEADTTNIHGIADTSILLTTTGTQTITNKTLTSPVINTPTGIVKADVGLANVDNTSDANKPVSTATASAIATAKSQAQGYADEQINLVIGAAPSALNTLSELADALGDDANFAGTITSSLSTKAPLASPTFTGTVTLPGSTVIGSVDSTEIGYLNGVTSSVQGQIDTKSPLASPTFTGTVTLPGSTVIGSVDSTEIAYLNGVTSGVQAQIDTKLASATAASTYAPLASPTFTGTVTLPSGTVTSEMIADGTILDSDVNASAAIAQSKISGLTSDLALKAPLASPTFTGTVSGITKTMVGLGNVDNTADTAKPVSTAQSAAIATAKAEAIADATAQVNAVIAAAPAALNTLDELAAALGDDANFATTITTSLAAKAPLASPTFTGTVSGITKTMVGLGNVDNTADTAKPVSTATQTALDLKAPLASPTFTGTVSGITKTMVGLGNVDNTADTAKPVSTATQTALDLKAPLASPTFTGTVTLPSGTVTSGMIADGTIATADIADSAITSAKIADGTIVNADVNASAAIAQSKISGLTSDLALKAPLASPTFTGTVSGITKTMVGLGNVDNTADTAKPVSTAQSAAIATAKAEAIADATAQVNALVTGAPAAMNTLDELAAALGDDANFAASVTTSLGLKVDSLTPISQKTASYTLSSLTERDDLIEMGSATAVTLSIPTDATLNFPIGTSIDVLQTGAGQVTIAAVTPGTTTVNATPGLKLRTTWSSCTLLKRAANTWVVFGDLTA